MKKISALAILLIGMTACSVNEIEQDITPALDTIEACTPEPDTKVHLAEGNYVHWTSGDRISVWDNHESQHEYTLTSGENSGTGHFEGVFDGYAKTAAAYPYIPNSYFCHSATEKYILIVMPNTYEYSEAEINKAPMASIITEQSEPIRFQNAGALMKLIVKNVPAGYNRAELTSGNEYISGQCKISFDENNIPTLNAYGKESGRTITITFAALATSKDMTFWFPIPVGTYEGLTLTIRGDGKDDIVVINNKSLTSARSNIYRKEVTL